MDGHPFGLRGRTLFVGEREHGTVEPGARVEIGSGVVRVDGTQRGPLPPPAAAPGGAR